MIACLLHEQRGKRRVPRNVVSGHDLSFSTIRWYPRAFELTTRCISMLRFDPQAKASNFQQLPVKSAVCLDGGGEPKELEIASYLLWIWLDIRHGRNFCRTPHLPAHWFEFDSCKEAYMRVQITGRHLWSQPHSTTG
jgi:hypothetical protein